MKVEENIFEIFLAPKYYNYYSRHSVCKLTLH